MFKKIFFILIMAISNITKASTCYDLIAGQNEVIGSVCVDNDQNNVYVTYQTNSFLIDSAHLYVGLDLSGLPVKKKGSPVFGHFPYIQENVNANTVIFTIPLSEFNNPLCGTNLVFMSHASVYVENSDGSFRTETAFSNGDRLLTKGNWAMFSNYSLKCVVPPPPPTGESCETTFAFGDITFIELGITNSRWGWQISNISPMTQGVAPLYSGAGQNNLSAGTHVGNLVYSHNGSDFSITYNLFNGFYLKATHVYLGVNDISTISPGQYGNQHTLNNMSGDHYIIPLNQNEANQNLNLVTHGEVCHLN